MPDGGVWIRRHGAACPSIAGHRCPGCEVVHESGHVWTALAPAGRIESVRVTLPRKQRLFHIQYSIPGGDDTL